MFPDARFELSYGGGREGYGGSRDIRLAPWTAVDAELVTLRGQVGGIDSARGWLELTGTGVGEASRNAAPDPAKVFQPPAQRAVFSPATRCEGCSSPLDLRPSQNIEAEGWWTGEGLEMQLLRVLPGP